jgi:site-specific recombinase XerD
VARNGEGCKQRSTAAAYSTDSLNHRAVLSSARYLDEGGDIASLMKLLGHSSLSVTQKYLHPEVDKAAEIVNKRNRRAVVLPDISPDIAAHSSWVN